MHTVKMRRVFRLLPIVGLVAVSTVVVAAPVARACSCASIRSEAAPLAFEGTVVQTLPKAHATPMWRFRVLHADRGAAPNGEIDVAITSPVDTPNGRIASSCDLSPSPLQLGARYRISAYVNDSDGAPFFYASQCSGSLELISERSDTASQRRDRDEESRLTWVLPAVIATAAASAAGLVIAWRRRRAEATSA